MAYDIAEPYGPLVETTLRLVTWNVWARFGPWESREAAIRATLERHDPDVVALVEAWDGQGERLGMPHHVFAGEQPESGLALLSRWPIERHEHRALAGPEGGTGAVLYAEIAGPRGTVQVFAVALTWRLGESGVRQAQVREVAAFAASSRTCGISAVHASSGGVSWRCGRRSVSLVRHRDRVSCGCRVFEELGSYNGRRSAKLGVARKGD